MSDSSQQEQLTITGPVPPHQVATSVFPSIEDLKAALTKVVADSAGTELITLKIYGWDDPINWRVRPIVPPSTILNDLKNAQTWAEHYHSWREAVVKKQTTNPLPLTSEEWWDLHDQAFTSTENISAWCTRTSAQLDNYRTLLDAVSGREAEEDAEVRAQFAHMLTSYTNTHQHILTYSCEECYIESMSGSTTFRYRPEGVMGDRPAAMSKSAGAVM